MDNSLLQQQADAFEREHTAFEQARARYLEACQKYHAFQTQDRIPPPPLTRAAYSDRMAWILATMAKLAYVPFEKQPEEYARRILKPFIAAHDIDEYIRKLERVALSRNKTYLSSTTSQHSSA